MVNQGASNSAEVEIFNKCVRVEILGNVKRDDQERFIRIDVKIMG